MKRPVFLTFLILLAGCGSDHLSQVDTFDTNQAFLDHSRNYINSYLAFRPVYASFIGVHTFDEELPDYSPKSIEAELVRIDGYHQLLASLPAGDLSSENLVDWEILESSMISWRSRLTEKPDFKRDPLYYNDIVIKGIEVLLRRDFEPAAKRMESLLSRLQQIPYFFEIARINLTEVPEILRASAENPLVNSMYMLRDSLPGRIKAQLKGKLPEGFEEAHLKAIYAYTDYILFVKDLLKQETTKEFALGMTLYFSRWSNEEALNMADSDTKTIREICKTKRELVLEKMKQVARSINPQGELKQVMSILESDSATIKWIVDTAGQQAEDLRDFTLENHLVSLPMPEYAHLKVIDPDPRTNRLVFTLMPGIRNSLPEKGYFTINPIPPRCTDLEKNEALRFFTPYTIALLTAGITYPGRYVQTLKGRNARSAVRQVLESATAQEGWSHYCQELITESGFDPRPEALLAQLKLSLMEINRLEACTLLHCSEMNVDQAVKFLSESSFISPSMAYREVVEMIRNPKTGAGMVGKAQIITLRDRYLEKGGQRSLKRFHDLFLSSGPAPVPVTARLTFGEEI